MVTINQKPVRETLKINGIESKHTTRKKSLTMTVSGKEEKIYKTTNKMTVVNPYLSYLECKCIKFPN